MINRVAEKNEIILCWIPSHQGYLGNEIADRKAKLATINPRNKEQIQVGVNKKFYRSCIREWGQKLHQRRWDNLNSCRQTKMILPKINNKCWKIVSKMNRRNAMYATQIITGHNVLNRHLNLMNIAENQNCENCGEEPETIEHVIKSCPAYIQKRKQKLGEFILSKDLQEYRLDKIISFVNLTGRLRIDNHD